jgi:riboflavin kinase
MGWLMSYTIQTLKLLAIKGASKHFVPVSTAEIGKELEVSQQTASNRIVALAKRGLVKRTLGTKGQKIRLTRDGIGLLRKEYSDYQEIFNASEPIEISGVVATGLGEGEYYLGRQGYKKQFKSKLGFIPYEGTLNVKVSDEEMAKLEQIPESRHILIEGFESDARTFGEAKCILVRIDGVDCAIVLPSRSHHNQIMEVISQLHLRKKFNLKDGDKVCLEIER